MNKPSSLINHITILLDASSSMSSLTHDVIKVTDAQISRLAQDSKFHDQETRVSVFTFSSPEYHDRLTAKCLIYDKDVLRVPSIAGLYKAHGNTALCDAMVTVITDLKMTPEKYGDHSHLVYLATDGQENASSPAGVRELPRMITALPGNWTLAAFVPDATAKRYLTRFGFAAGNIEIWDPSRRGAVEEVGRVMATASAGYMTSRASGLRSTTSLFTANAPSASTLKKGLTPLTPGSYYFEEVRAEDLARIVNGRIDQFMELKTGTPYAPGLAYYEFTKRERIQDYKKICVAVYDKDSNAEVVYGGAAARQLLGLPDRGEVRVSPGGWERKGYKVFILSTSNNRKLVPGTRVLVMR